MGFLQDIKLYNFVSCTYKLHFIVCHLKELICRFIPCKSYPTKVMNIFGICHTAKK